MQNDLLNTARQQAGTSDPPIRAAALLRIARAESNHPDRARSTLRWQCKCGHVWNTFWTAGNCPACHFQWEVTQCPSCSQMSEHQAWYVSEP